MDRKAQKQDKQCSECSDGMITKSVPLNFERTRQQYESNVPLPLAAPSSSHLPGQDLACTAAIDLELSNLLAWGWVDTDAVHSHHEYIHYIYMNNIHEHVWIGYGYVFMCVQVYQCMFMYIYGYVLICVQVYQCMFMHISMYLLFSSKLREQKRKYIIYSACRWNIEFNGTTKRLSKIFAHRQTAAVSTCSYPVMLDHKLPEFHGIFSRLLLQNEENVMALQGIRWIIHICPYLIPHPWPWPAHPCCYNGRVLIPRESSLSAGSQLEHFILLVGWYLGVP